MPDLKQPLDAAAIKDRFEDLARRHRAVFENYLKELTTNIEEGVAARLALEGYNASDLVARASQAHVMELVTDKHLLIDDMRFSVREYEKNVVGEDRRYGGYSKQLSMNMGWQDGTAEMPLNPPGRYRLLVLLLPVPEKT